MTIDMFIDICERSFSEQKMRLGPSQKAIYHEKMRRFTGQQVDSIYEKTLETCRNFPKIKDIYDAARDLGYLQTEQDAYWPHRWESTDCNLCRGEGRLCVTWLLMSEIHNDSRREIHALKRILPYSLSCNSEHFRLEAGEFRSLFRCSCMAGDVGSIPKSWPKWSRAIEPVRTV